MYSAVSTTDLVAHANSQANLSDLEVALLDRLQVAMEEIDILVAHLDNYRGEEALQTGEDSLDADS